MEYTCQICGKSFSAVRKTAYCLNCRTIKCVICGNDFVRTTKNPNQVTCSHKCSGVYRKQSGISKQVADKAKRTLSARYGAANAGAFRVKSRICEYCGKEFTPTSNRQKWCSDPHYGPCPVCGKSTLIRDMHIGPQCCSIACRSKLIEKTSLERYGAKNVFASEYGKAKIKETIERVYGDEKHFREVQHASMTATMLNRYGVESPLQSDEIKNKVVQTNMSRYGVPYVMQNPDIQAKQRRTAEAKGGYSMTNPKTRAKIQSTVIEKYGVDNVLKSPEIREKIKTTNLTRYGTMWSASSPTVQAKIRETNLKRYGTECVLSSNVVREKATHTIQEKYGVSNVFQLDSVKQKSAQTNLQRYGAANWKSSQAYLNTVIPDANKVAAYDAFKSDVRAYVATNYAEPPTIYQLSLDFGIKPSAIYPHIVAQNCQDCIKYYESNMESEIKDFLLGLDPNMQIIMHDRKVIAPYEFDIYLPEYHFAIECNPTYTHNSSCGAYSRETPLPRTYHAVKSQMALSAGIELFHVFGYEWVDTPDVIKSMIKTRLGFIKTRIYARNTHVEEISYKEVTAFLTANHRQGFTPTKICLGLRLNSDNTLVSLMTFNPMKAHQGHREVDSDDWELSRFCNLRDTTVVGGASKLFKYFVDNYSFGKLVSFSDIAHTSGKLYQLLGFTQVSESAPSYVWVHLKTDAYYKRTVCMKSKLKKLFNDPNIDIEHLTEKQIMENHGYVQVFDSGLIRWEYNR